MNYYKYRFLLDEVLLRDSCGLSRKKLKDMYYYNEYDSGKFKFNPKYGELTLLDMLDGEKTFTDYLIRILPFVILLVISIVAIAGNVIICCCFSCPKCCLKRNTDKTRNRICLIVYECLALVVTVLFIVAMIFIQKGKTDISSSLCTLLMLQEDILNGQGLIGKKNFIKPYWYGTNKLGEFIEEFSALASDLGGQCASFIGDYSGGEKISLEGGYTAMKEQLSKVYEANRGKTVENPNPNAYYSSETQNIMPLFISKLGPLKDNTTHLGKIQYQLENNFNKIKLEIFDNIEIKCAVLQFGGGPLVAQLNSFSEIISEVNNSLEQVSENVTKLLSKYADIVKSFIFSFFFCHSDNTDCTYNYISTADAVFL